MVLYAVAATSAAEIDWITRGVGMFFPQAWEAFSKGAAEAGPCDSLVEAYHKLLMHSDQAVRERAARRWCDWEMAIVPVHPGHKPHPRWQNPAFRLGFARLVTHYWRHKGWVDGDRLVGAKGLEKIPGILIHGRVDLGGPTVTPWRLHRNWPGSELVLVGGAGHDARDPGMAEVIVAATNRFSSM